jgi:hypothetical protein
MGQLRTKRIEEAKMESLLSVLARLVNGESEQHREREWELRAGQGEDETHNEMRRCPFGRGAWMLTRDHDPVPDPFLLTCK